MTKVYAWRKGRGREGMMSREGCPECCFIVYFFSLPSTLSSLPLIPSLVESGVDDGGRLSTTAERRDTPGAASHCVVLFSRLEEFTHTHKRRPAVHLATLRSNATHRWVR